MINIGVCFGGKSVEHDISIITYFQVLHALDQKKYNIIPIYLDKNNNLKTISNKVCNVNEFIKTKIKNLKISKKKNDLYLSNKKVDLVLLCVHGKGLESGEVRGFFDMLGVTTVSPTVKSSAVFHNKFLTKILCESIGVKVVPYKRVTKEEYDKKSFDIDKKYKDQKVIIKPTSLGSSIGIYKANNLETFQEGIVNAFHLDDEVIIEPVIENFREISQAAYLKKEKIILSKLDEVVNTDGYYSFEEKYKPKESFHVLPTSLDNKIKSKISNITKKLISLFGDTGVYRVDYIVKDDDVYVNEVNVIPGGFAFSLFEAKDISFSDLLDDLIKEAIHQRSLEDEKVTTYSSSVLENISMKK